MKQIQEYCSKFSGIFKIFKMVQASTLLKNQCQQGFETALNFAQQEGIYKIYRYIESTAQDWKITQLNIDKEIANQQFSKYQAEVNRIEKDITTYKNQQNKLSTGLSYIELGNLYLKAGDVTEAYRSYERVNNYYESGDVLSFHLQWSATMLIERRYDQLKTITPKEALPTDKKRREQYTTLLIFQALRCLYQGDIHEFLTIIKEQIQHDCIVEDPNLLLVTNHREIGILVTLCALARCSRLQAQELLKSDGIRYFVTQDNEFLTILEAYIGLDYNPLMVKLKILCAEFEWDFLYKKFNFGDVIIEKIIKQYLLPFKKVSLKKVTATLDLYEGSLDYIKRLIQNDQINFLYDPVDEVLVQKVTERSKKYNTYKQAVETIQSFLLQKQHQMLKYHLSLVHSENSIKNKQDPSEQGSSNFGQLSKLVGNFMDGGQFM